MAILIVAVFPSRLSRYKNDTDLPILYSEHLTGDGQKMFEHAAKLNWQGIVSKNAGTPYRSGRNEAWPKVNCVQTGKFPVIDFIKDPTGLARFISGRRQARTWSTSEKSARVGPAPSLATSGSSSIALLFPIAIIAGWYVGNPINGSENDNRGAQPQRPQALLGGLQLKQRQH
jgi:hypothetical protein